MASASEPPSRRIGVDLGDRSVLHFPHRIGVRLRLPGTVARRGACRAIVVSARSPEWVPRPRSSHSGPATPRSQPPSGRSSTTPACSWHSRPAPGLRNALRPAVMALAVHPGSWRECPAAGWDANPRPGPPSTATRNKAASTCRPSSATSAWPRHHRPPQRKQEIVDGERREASEPISGLVNRALREPTTSFAGGGRWPLRRTASHRSSRSGAPGRVRGCSAGRGPRAAR